MNLEIGLIHERFARKVNLEWDSQLETHLHYMGCHIFNPRLFILHGCTLKLSYIIWGVIYLTLDYLGHSIHLHKDLINWAINFAHK